MLRYLPQEWPKSSAVTVGKVSAETDSAYGRSAATLHKLGASGHTAHQTFTESFETARWLSLLD